MADLFHAKLIKYRTTIESARRKWADCKALSENRASRCWDNSTSPLKRKALHLRERYDTLINHSEALCSLGGCPFDRCFRRREQLLELLERFEDLPVGPETAACQFMRAIVAVNNELLKEEVRIAEREEWLLDRCDVGLQHIEWGLEWARREATRVNLDFAHQWAPLLAEAEEQLFDVREGIHSHEIMLEILLQLQDLAFGKGTYDVRITFGAAHGIELMRDRSPYEMKDSWLAEWHLNRRALAMAVCGILVPRQRLITEFFLEHDMFAEPRLNTVWSDPDRSHMVVSTQKLITEFFPDHVSVVNGQRVQSKITEIKFSLIKGPKQQLMTDFFFAVLDHVYCVSDTTRDRLSVQRA